MKVIKRFLIDISSEDDFKKLIKDLESGSVLEKLTKESGFSMDKGFIIEIKYFFKELSLEKKDYEILGNALRSTNSCKGLLMTTDVVGLDEFSHNDLGSIDISLDILKSGFWPNSIPILIDENIGLLDKQIDQRSIDYGANIIKKIDELNSLNISNSYKIFLKLGLYTPSSSLDNEDEYKIKQIQRMIDLLSEIIKKPFINIEIELFQLYHGSKMPVRDTEKIKIERSLKLDQLNSYDYDLIVGEIEEGKDIFLDDGKKAVDDYNNYYLACIIFSNEKSRYFDLEQASLCLTRIETYPPALESILQGKNLMPFDIEEQRINYYLAGLIYNNLNSKYYNPDLAFDCFQNCGEYLPALKAILPFYIAAICNEEGNIENPQALALAQQTAAIILSQEPDNQQAKAFLEREKTYKQSIKISEKFNTIVSQPMKSLVFFSGIMKQMHQTALLDRKNTQNENYAEDRAAAQQEWDKNYGLTVISEKDQGPSI